MIRQHFLPDREGLLRFYSELLWQKARKLRSFQPVDLALFQSLGDIGRIVEDRQAEPDERTRRDSASILFSQHSLQVTSDLQQLLTRKVTGPATFRETSWMPLNVPNGIHHPEETSLGSRDQVGTSLPEFLDYSANRRNRSQRISFSRSSAHRHF